MMVMPMAVMVVAVVMMVAMAVVVRPGAAVRLRHGLVGDGMRM